jgi:hypothetical protein
MAHTLLVAMAEINLGMTVVHRCVNTLSLSVVNTVSVATDKYFSPLESLCVAGLAFVVVGFVLDGKSIHLRLLKRVCLLYCNQRARMLFDSDQGTVMGLFSNLILAVSLAVLLWLMDNQNGQDSDLHGIFEGMLYLYSDILDFAFGFGVFKITLFAFIASLLLDSFDESNDPVYSFCVQLFKIISANLISQGINMLIQSTPQLELFECLACVAILKLMFPSMGEYFVYLAAQRVYFLFPSLAPVMFSAVLWLDFLPVVSRGWVGELCCIYVVTAVATFLYTIPIGGVVVVLVLAHYMDQMLTLKHF